METTLKMAKKVTLATQGLAPTVSKELVMKTYALFGIFDNDEEQQVKKTAKMWTGGQC